MGNHPTGPRLVRRNSLFKMAAAMVLAALLLAAMAPPLVAQSGAGQAPAGQAPAGQSPAAQPSKMPDWQIAAGGKMAFDVASVKPDNAAQSAQTVSSNVALGPGDYYSPTGGRFSATNLPLLTYLAFAYKATGNQLQILRAQAPKWVLSDQFDIEARAGSNPTKDQMRLMMQALLVDRFKLAVHIETRQLPMFGLALAKPGKLGPQLQAHPENTPCSTAPELSGAPGSGAASPTVAGGFPTPCGGIQPMTASNPGRIRFGARNVGVALLATTLTGIGSLDRPVLDQTGLNGTYDLVIEWTPQLNGPLPPGVDFQPDPTGPTFLEALKEQIGLKLESQTGPVDVIVVDHVEQPSEN